MIDMMKSAVAALVVFGFVGISLPGQQVPTRDRTDRKAIFATTGANTKIAVLLPAYLVQLFGEDWYKQTLFSDQLPEKPLQGQQFPPQLVWKQEGLVFGANIAELKKWRNTTTIQVLLYSLEKKIAYHLQIDLEKEEVRVDWSCHTKDGPEEVSPTGLLLNGLKCKEWQK